MDDNRRRMSGTEQREIHALFAAITLLKDDALRERLGQVRYGRRDYAMIIKTLYSLCERLMDTIPTQQLISLRRNLKEIGCTVGVRRPIHRNDAEYGMWLSYDALNALAPAIHDACLLCDRSPGEQRRCPLRAALREMPIDVVVENDEAGKCPYFGGI